MGAEPNPKNNQYLHRLSPLEFQPAVPTRQQGEKKYIYTEFEFPLLVGRLVASRDSMPHHQSC